MKNDKYWKHRSEQRMYEYIQDADRVADEIGRVYLRAAQYLENQIKKIFDKYRLGSGLNEAEARRILNEVGNSINYDSLKKAYKRVKDPDLKKTLLNQLNAPAYRARIERLQQLQDDLNTKCQELYKIETKAVENHLIDTTQNAYYRAMYDTQRGIGYGFGFAQMSEQGANEIIRNNWSGASYSSRIWNNTQTVADLIKNELFVGIMTGKSQHDMAAVIMDKMGVGAMQARRLVRTESCYVANQAEMESYKECEIDKYRFVATLDLRTSDICASLDGKEFLVKKEQTGVNCPPMHPNCRSTTIAVFDKKIMDKMRRRAIDPETGEDIFVPADMSYSEWYDKYVTNNPAGKIAEKKFANSGSDRKQWDKYKNIIPELDIPKTFSEFQTVKYENQEVYRFMKIDYKRRSTLLKHKELSLPNARTATAADEKFIEYLFNPSNKKGWAKGVAFESRLGYNKNNWLDLKHEILSRASDYPTVYKGKVTKSGVEYGDKYEQQIIVYGVKGRPANVLVGWIVENGNPRMTTALIKEAKDQ